MPATISVNKNWITKPIADLTALKAIDTTSVVDGTIVQIKSLGHFRFDKTSSEAANDKDIITPTVGGGRWKRLTLPFMTTDATGTKISSAYLDVTSPFLYKGTISIAADFPTLATVQAGWFYEVLADVTDNDPTKTNTGLSFVIGDEIVWNGSTWNPMGASVLPIARGGTNSSTALANGKLMASSGSAIVESSVNTPDQNLSTTNSPTFKKVTAADAAGGVQLEMGIETNLATPAVTMVSKNSGFAAPSNVGATSAGDKWVFWNYTGTYKGAIGFNSREMWFQSTDQGATANRFKWFGGSASVPVELLSVGDLGFVWNDARSDIDFSIRKVTSGDAYTYDFGLGAHQFTGTFTLSSLTTANGILTTSAAGLVSSSTALPDGTTATTQTLGDNTTKVATTAFVQAAITGGVNAVTDAYTPTLGQTVFTLSQTRSADFHFILTLNGQVREETTDFTVSGTTLTWLNPAGLTLKTTDRLIARYYY